MLKINSTSNNKITVTMNKSDETIRLVKLIPSETEKINSRFNLDNKLDKCGKSYNNYFCFYSWLVGFTDGDGCFNVYTNLKNKKIIFTFKIGQRSNNKQILHFIKKNLMIGSIRDNKLGMSNFLVRKKEYILNIIIPLFKKYNLLSTKEFNFKIFCESFDIYLNSDFSQVEKINLINKLKEKIVPINYVSTFWLKNENIINKSWLVGFIEAEGSFYIIKKEEGRLVHGFGITQKKDKIILDNIKIILNIKSIVKYNKNGFYTLDSLDSTSLKYIKDYFFKSMKSRKALIYRIWARSFRLKGKYKELLKIQNKIRSLV